MSQAAAFGLFVATSGRMPCILARNVLASDAGTRYVHICHPEWDHHVRIWDRAASSNHYKLCAELDTCLASLMEDLAATRCCMMCHDLERRVRSEVDAQNGAMVREGRRLGLPLPVNEYLWQRIREKEGRSAVPEGSGANE